jgi:pimeloyl-ACP methyl ester carboxylesterase
VLALQGAEDPYGSDAQLLVLRDNAGATVTTRLIDGARHAPHLEAAETTLAAITDFIANLPRSAAP